MDRLLSSGSPDAIPARLVRHIRVANALALLGVMLSLVSAPLDAYGSMDFSVVFDLTGGGGLRVVWYLNARDSTTPPESR